MTDARLTVGAFARRAGLTAKALRHYDRIGLLRPETVDDAGYRWYSGEQLDIARRIAALRSVDVPIEDVRRALTGDLDDVLAAHRRRLDARLARVQRQRHTLDHLHTDGLEPAMTDTDTDLTDERRLGAALFNATWTMLEKEQRTRADDDAMLHMAHASRHHWGRAADVTPAHLGRGEWQCSRVYAVLGRAEPCLHHAQRYLDICTENGIADWDLAFAYEALARGHAVAGDPEQARAFTEQALAAAEQIAEDDERELVLSDLETIPGQPRFW
ncbi:MAG: MerR family transcriptional regulator [Jatrophihabitantaceae bacterium]